MLGVKINEHECFKKKDDLLKLYPEIFDVLIRPSDRIERTIFTDNIDEDLLKKCIKKCPKGITIVST